MTFDIEKCSLPASACNLLWSEVEFLSEFPECQSHSFKEMEGGPAGRPEPRCGPLSQLFCIINILFLSQHRRWSKRRYYKP